MIDPIQKKSHRASIKGRQLEIERRLAVFGLKRGPRRLLRSPGVAPNEDSHCHRLRAALVTLGPLFSHFGIYLSSRVDLLPANYCVELSAIPDQAEATPIALVRDTIAHSVGCIPEQVYVAFEGEPFESRLLFQSHSAWLGDGSAVTVKVAHPGVEEQIAFDQELLPLLRDAFVSIDWTDSQIERVIADFLGSLQQKMDFRIEAGALDALAQDSGEFGMFRVPKLHKHLCSSKVLTIERLPGIALADLIQSFHERGSETHEMSSAAIDPNDLASSLCFVWLQQALLGNHFPIEPTPESILILPDKQIAFSGGNFAQLTPESRTNLLDYLIAASTEDPHKACSCLLREMDREKKSVNEEDLQLRFRQVVPFRDGGWSSAGTSDSLAEHLFLHWSLASRHGYRPQPHMVCFCKGLFQISAVARRLAPDRDSLLEALGNLRFAATLMQFQEMMGVRELGQSIDKYATMMLELPKKLDEVLTLAAEGSARVKLSVLETAEPRRQKNSLAVTLALLLVLAAVVLLSKYVGQDENTGRWSERIGAILFVLIGAMLIRATSNARR